MRGQRQLPSGLPVGRVMGRIGGDSHRRATTCAHRSHAVLIGRERFRLHVHSEGWLETFWGLSRTPRLLNFAARAELLLARSRDALEHGADATMRSFASSSAA